MRAGCIFESGALVCSNPAGGGSHLRLGAKMAHTMEGFLDKKGSGGSVFGRTNWNKRWFVLDGVRLLLRAGFRD